MIGQTHEVLRAPFETASSKRQHQFQLLGTCFQRVCSPKPRRSRLARALGIAEDLDWRSIARGPCGLSFPIPPDGEGKTPNRQRQEVARTQKSPVSPSPFEGTKPSGPKLPRPEYLLDSIWKDKRFIPRVVGSTRLKAVTSC